MNDLTTTSKTASMDFANLDERYVRRLSPDPSGGYTATIHEFPGCIAEGDTADEALSNLEQTALSWIRSATANGYPVAPPVDYEGASGKIALRISRRLHQLAAERADLEGVSLNQFIGNALANYLGQQDGMQRLAMELHRAVQQNLYYFYARGFGFMHEVSTLKTQVIPTMRIKEVGVSNYLNVHAIVDPKVPMEVLNG